MTPDRRSRRSGSAIYAAWLAEYRLPLPARYLIDTQSIIRAANVNADYTIRPEPSETVRQLWTLSI
jgi:hypothetical protein